MFYDCEMKSISLPSTLKSIHYQAFRDCEELLEIDLPDGLEDPRGERIAYREQSSFGELPHMVEQRTLDHGGFTSR